jgi:aspartyl-tRNA synthetase
MVKSIERYSHETIVVVHGKLRKAPKPVKNATIHDYELDIYEVHKVTGLSENVPFSVYDAENINRDKPDLDDEDADDTEDTPPSETPTHTDTSSPQDSQEWSRLVEKGLDSKSKIYPLVSFHLLTLYSQLGCCSKTANTAYEGAIEQSHCGPPD